MDAKEFELHLNDLETRVDRLRALYENWFRGYEKTEPHVARKDVERRVYAMRKELPRNTALRFRYHQLYQRYTTLANYWQRTAKQIEEGTYRLQLQRMRRKGANSPGRDRESDLERAGPRAYELDFDESLSVDDLLSDGEMDEVARAVDKPTPSSLPPLRKSLLSSMPPLPTPVAPRPRPEPAAASPRPVPSPPEARPRPAAPVAPSSPQPMRAAAAILPASSAPKPVPTATPAPAPAFAKPTPSATFRLPNAAVPVRPVAPANHVGAALPPASAAGASSGPNEERLRRIYDEYASARRRNNEGEVRYDHVVSSIQKMLPELQKKYQGKSIDFEIVVKDGRVGLKPRAR